MIDAGGSAQLDLSSLTAGDYTVYCQIPGHKEAGMTAALHVTAGGGAQVAAPMAGTDMSSMSSMSPEQMDQAMKDSIGAFPAKTEGLGAQVLAPTVLADGTKQFELTAAVDEVGGRHRARRSTPWTYNGTVPGPTIKVDPGDQRQRRVAQPAARVDVDSLPRPRSSRTQWTASPTSPRTPVKPGTTSPTTSSPNRRRPSACTTRTTTP